MEWEASRGRYRGVTVIYCVVTISVLMMMVSLGVDLGRVQLAKTELRCVADAAARAAAANLSNGVASAQDAAAAIASANKVDGSAFSLDSTNDIEFGRWDTSTGSFTALSGSARGNADAIRVNARRVAARGTGIKLLFAQVLGRDSCDVVASATVRIVSASITGGTGIALSSISIKNDARVDSYNSNSGAYSSGTAGSLAVLQTNGDISVKNNAFISGEAHPGQNGSISIRNSARVSGSTAALSQTLEYPEVTAGSAASSNNNSSIPGSYLDDDDGDHDRGHGNDDDHDDEDNPGRGGGHHGDDDDDDRGHGSGHHDDDDDDHGRGGRDCDDDDDNHRSAGSFAMEDRDSYTMPSGTYYFKDFTLKDDAVLATSGQVIIYVTGEVSIDDDARITAFQNKTGNVQIKVIGNGDVTVKGNTSIAANIYAPQSSFTLKDDAVLHGGVVADEIEISDDAKFHFDVSGVNGATAGSGTAVLSTVH